MVISCICRTSQIPQPKQTCSHSMTIWVKCQREEKAKVHRSLWEWSLTSKHQCTIQVDYLYIYTLHVGKPVHLSVPQILSTDQPKKCQVSKIHLAVKHPACAPTRSRRRSRRQGPRWIGNSPTSWKERYFGFCLNILKQKMLLSYLFVESHTIARQFQHWRYKQSGTNPEGLGFPAPTIVRKAPGRPILWKLS